MTMTACSRQAPPSAPGAVERETKRMQPIVDRYKAQSVMGFDLKGTTLLLSVDAEGWSQLDESSEISLKNAVLDAWARTWKLEHPRQHAIVHLRVQNYYGQEINSQQRSV